MVGVPATNDYDSLRSPAVLESLLQGMGQAARRGGSRASFVTLWLSGVVAAVGARGGTIYEYHPEGKRRSVLASNGRNDVGEHDAVHALALRTGKSQWSKGAVHAASQIVDLADETIFVESLKLDRVCLMVELRFVNRRTSVQRQVCERTIARAKESAAEFFIRERLTKLERQLASHDRHVEFIKQIHQAPICRRVAVLAVEEAARRLSFDRVTLLIRKGRRFVPVAVSGSAEFDSRSAAIKALTVLTERAAVTGETVSFTASGSSERLPPQIAQGFAECVDVTLAHTTIVVPLLTQKETNTGQPFAGVILERFSDSAAPVDENDLEFLQVHAAGALESAVEHEKILFHAWRRKLGVASDVVFLNHRARGWACLAFLVAIVALTVIPAGHSVSASGTLRPVERRDIFAPFDAYVDVVHVRHGDHISRGTVLMELSDPQLDSMIQQCEGERNSARERHRALDRAGVGGTLTTSSMDQLRIAGERDALREQLETSEVKLRQLREMKSRLIITSPLDGDVLSWDVSRTLDHRPVRRGQSLLQLANTAGEWEIEAYIEQCRLGHLLQALEDSDEPLTTSVRLSSDPAREITGVVQEVGDTVRYVDGIGDVVPITIRVTDANCPLRHVGSDVSVKVLCGRRSLGYVWFHELFDFMRIRIWSAFA